MLSPYSEGTKYVWGYGVRCSDHAPPRVALRTNSISDVSKLFRSFFVEKFPSRTKSVTVTQTVPDYSASEDSLDEF